MDWLYGIVDGLNIQDLDEQEIRCDECDNQLRDLDRCDRCLEGEEEM